jgi:hypothetical protein
MASMDNDNKNPTIFAGFHLKGLIAYLFKASAPPTISRISLVIEA